MRIVATLIALMLPVVAFAQNSGGAENFAKLTDEQIIQGLLEANFFTVDCDIPFIQPKLCDLASTPTVNRSQLIKIFFGDKDKVHSEEIINNALWGRGTRIKSGYTIVVGPSGMPIQMAIEGFGTEMEMIPAYMDVFMLGFAYRNNVPHQPVYVSVHKPTSLVDPVIKYEYVYEPAEGAAAAEALIAEMFEELSLAEGFQSSIDAFVLRSGERLFYYKATPQFLTTFTIYEGFNTDSTGRIVPIAAGEAPVAVPILDRFVTVILDGNKMLAGLDYFWDSDIKPLGQPKEVLKASEVMLTVRESILDYFGGSPPLISVREIKLGYIQSRQTQNKLIPVWMFDAAYSRQLTQNDRSANQITQLTDSTELVPFPIAVNALTGEPFLL